MVSHLRSDVNIQPRQVPHKNWSTSSLHSVFWLYDAGIAANGADPPSASALASEQHEESQQSLTAVAGRFDPVAPAALGAQPTQNALSSQQCAYSSPACIDLASSFSFWAGSAPAADCAVRAMKPAGQKPRHAVNQIQCGSLDAHAE